jgi:hypothetical protein
MLRAKVMTGKATAPPPSDVAPPIMEPKIIVIDIYDNIESFKKASQFREMISLKWSSFFLNYTSLLNAHQVTVLEEGEIVVLDGQCPPVLPSKELSAVLKQVKNYVKLSIFPLKGRKFPLIILKFAKKA